MIESIYKLFLCWFFFKLIKFVYNPSLLWSLWNLLFLPGLSSDCIVKLVPYYPYYKKKSKMVKTIHDLFLWSLSKVISLLSISSHCIIKVINLLYDMLDMGKYWFAIYYLYIIGLT